jgi:hypothetical protein
MLNEDSPSGFPRRLSNSLYNRIFNPQLLLISNGPLPFKFKIKSELQWDFVIRTVRLFSNLLIYKLAALSDTFKYHSHPQSG